MKKNEVTIGGKYIAKVSNILTVVRITSVAVEGGWKAINEATGREVHIATAGRLRGPAPAPKCPVPMEIDILGRLKEEAEKASNKAFEQALAERKTLEEARVACKKAYDVVLQGGK
jgi:hypothetical protein